MIYCVWYPSGGFGHFINAVLTLHGDNFVRPMTKSLKFSANGNSHNLDLVVPKYNKDGWPGDFEFLDSKNYSVLIDNGINNESDKFRSTFPGATVIKICYSDHSWPVIARTFIEKAMKSSLEEQLTTDQWGLDEPWSRREKYFLFLRDHSLRSAWRSQNNKAIFLDELYDDYDLFFYKLNSIVSIEPCINLWREWRDANAKYFNPINTARIVTNMVIAKKSLDLTHITDIWTQAVIYYYIWLKFNIEVPHYDFSNFFTNTDQLIELVA